jgi:hypothetical protein
MWVEEEVWVVVALLLVAVEEDLLLVILGEGLEEKLLWSIGAYPSRYQVETYVLAEERRFCPSRVTIQWKHSPWEEREDQLDMTNEMRYVWLLMEDGAE